MLCTVGYNFLKNEIGRFKGNYLEIGVFDGDLIASLARENPTKKFYGIDPFIEDGYTKNITNVLKGQTIISQKDVALSKLNQCSNLKYYIETSEVFLSKLSDQDCTELNVDCVLIDGSHWYKDVIIDTEVAMKLIGNKKGLIIFDDLHVPEVNQACDDFIKNYANVITKITNTEQGIVDVSRKPHIVVIYINNGEIN